MIVLLFATFISYIPNKEQSQSEITNGKESPTAYLVKTKESNPVQLQTKPEMMIFAAQSGKKIDPMFLEALKRQAIKINQKQGLFK